MNLADRLRAIGVTDDRLAQVGLASNKAADLTDLATATADVQAYRDWLTASPFDRAAVRARVGTDAISRGKALDERLPK
jgi:hypothetical protein